MDTTLRDHGLVTLLACALALPATAASGDEPAPFTPDANSTPAAEAAELELPEWIGPDPANEAAESIAKAFHWTPTESLGESLPEPAPKVVSDDIGVLLSEAGAMLNEPTPRELIAQLERAASDARGAHLLGRLVRRSTELQASPEFQASATLDEVERLRKLTAWAHDARGALRASQGDHAAALADFEQALELDRRNRSALHNLAISLAESGRGDAALAAFDRLIEVAPDSPSARRNRAELLFTMDKAEVALSDCDYALRTLDPSAGDAAQMVGLLRLRGRVLQRLGKRQEAVDDFSLALRLQPRDAALLHARGDVFSEAGQYKQAVEDYVASLHANPSSGEVYTSLAWVLATCPQQELRDPATAVEAAWRARRLMPSDDQRMLEASAAAYAAVGDYPEAVRLQQRAVLASGEESASDAMRTRLAQYEQQSSASGEDPATPLDYGVLPAGHQTPMQSPSR